MLSRVANSLFWMSRYIERAENVARLVDVNLQLLLDLKNLDEARLSEHWLPIIQSTGDEEAFFKLYSWATGQAVTEFLVFHPENSNSIVVSIADARENARMVRDQITSEFWEELNRLYLFVRSRQARDLWASSPLDFFQEVKSASLKLQGMADATLMRNEGWLFMQLGKYIERADKTSRILDVRYQTLPERGVPKSIGQEEVLEWSAILNSCSAWDAYKSIHGAEVHPRLVAEFLLLSEAFPRSLEVCVAQFNQALRKISGVAEGRISNEAERLAGRLLAEVQFCTIDEVFERGLHQYLDDLQIKLNNIGAAIFNAYFFHSIGTMEEQVLAQQEEMRAGE